MKSKIISKKAKMIIAFLGYSFLPESLAHLELGEYGLGVIYDYSDFECDLAELWGEQNYLFAFSMGVAVAEKICKEAEFKKAVAMNGTPFGIDEKFGIPKELFKASLDNFDFENFKRLCFLKDLAKVNFAFNANPKAELEMLYRTFCEQKCEKNIIWDKIISSNKDMIFPKSALNACFESDKIISINAPHFGLFSYTSWEQIFEI